MITIVAKAVLKDGGKQQFVDATRELIAGSRNEEGNIAYDLHEDIDDESSMCFIEVWKDDAAIESHNASEHFRKGIATIQPLCESLTVSKFRKL